MADETHFNSNGNTNDNPKDSKQQFQTKETVTEWSRAKIIKNLIIVSITSSLLFTGCGTVQKLQSSINLSEGLGTASLSVQSATNMLSGVFLVTYTVKGLGTKNTILLCIFIMALYVASNFYASWYTLMPSSFVVGVAYACVYTALYTYVSHLASYYSVLTGIKRPLVVSKFFGIFFMALQSSGVLGGIVGYYALQTHPTLVHNGTSTKMICGKDFCDTQVDPHSSKFSAPIEEIYLLCGILVALTVASFLVVLIFLDKLDIDVSEKQTLCETLKLLARRQRNIFHILLIPVTIYSGLQLSFITADFTKAFITCTSSIQYVGFVLVTYSLSDTISSLLLGQLVQLIGRTGVFLMAASVDFAMIMTMYLWTPDHDSQYVLFIIAGIWGIGDGVWQGQIKAMYSSLFPNHKEPAFSLQGSWECLGITVGFAYSSLICAKYSLYILLSCLLLGILCYLIAEYILYKKGNTD